MINRQMRSVELWQVSENTEQLFGNDEEYTKIANISMAIYERNISRYNSNDNDIISYDMVGLTDYGGKLEKDMYILSDGIKYNVQYVCNSHRLRQVLLKRAE